MADARDNPLWRYTDTAANGAGFCAIRHGSLATLTPLTERARAWLREHVVDDEEVTTWEGDMLVVEMGYFALLADAIMAAGFTFERSELPN